MDIKWDTMVEHIHEVVSLPKPFQTRYILLSLASAQLRAGKAKHG